MRTAKFVLIGMCLSVISLTQAQEGRKGHHHGKKHQSAYHLETFFKEHAISEEKQTALKAYFEEQKQLRENAGELQKEERQALRQTRQAAVKNLLGDDYDLWVEHRQNMQEKRKAQFKENNKHDKGKDWDPNKKATREVNAFNAYHQIDESKQKQLETILAQHYTAVKELKQKENTDRSEWKALRKQHHEAVEKVLGKEDFEAWQKFKAEQREKRKAHHQKEGKRKQRNSNELPTK